VSKCYVFRDGYLLEPPLLQFDRIIPLGQKNGGFDISKAAVRKMGITMDCCTTAFFFCRRAAVFVFLFT
jgi:hypothetical protein